MKKLLLLPILLACVSSFAQLTLKRADKYFEKLEFEKAAHYYEAFLYKKDDAYSQLQLAKIYTRLNDPVKSEKWYREVIHRDDLEAIHYLNYAQSLSSLGKYKEAIPFYNKYQSLADDKLLAKEKTYGLNHIDEFYEDSNLVAIKEAGFNSVESEFAPTYYKEAIVFASDRGNTIGIQRKFSWNNKNYLNLYTANGDDASKFEKGVNSKYHEGAASFSADGNTIFFTRNNFVKGKFGRSKDGVNKLKIYSATKNGSSWGNEQEFTHNSSEYSTGDPFLSADGNTLYFISDMPDGFGGTDIYKCTKNGDTWGAPENLGHKINSEGDERTPFIDEEGNLYFASEGHFGLGGLDIYKAEGSNGSFSEVINMGYPINSTLDDFGFIIKIKSREGYLASNRADGTGRDDIYSFTIKEDPKVACAGKVYAMTEGQPSSSKQGLNEAQIVVYNKTNGHKKNYVSGQDGSFNIGLKPGFLYEISASKDTLLQDKSVVDLRNKSVKTISPVELTLVRKLPKPTKVPFEGKVVDATNSVVDSPSLFLLNTSNGSTEELKTNAQGEFSTVLDPNTKYLLKTEKKGYLINCLSFKTPNASREAYTLSSPVTLEKLELNTKLEVENLYYDLGKSNITPQAGKELEKVVQFMKDNPGITVELGAHTDARGSASGNSSLSGKRAKSARDYIVSKGVKSSRITSKGYGESQILNKCKDGVTCTEDEYAINRRTEIKITGVGNAADIVALTKETAFAGESSASCKYFNLKKK